MQKNKQPQVVYFIEQNVTIKNGGAQRHPPALHHQHPTRIQP
ncbi:hypothetical protein [Bartonella sp. AP58NXGY]